VVKTVASLPDTYTGDLFLAINDLDLDVVARNLIMLLVALKVEDRTQAVQSIIHTFGTRHPSALQTLRSSRNSSVR
jgi:hypothetical protein